MVITGPGRTGTSVLAKLSREAGRDPGGEWYEDVRAGLEHPDVVEINEHLIDELGITVVRGQCNRTIARLVRRMERHDSPALGMLAAAMRKSEWLAGSGFSGVDWSRLGAASNGLAKRMIEVSSRLEIAKDPRFMWTLPCWLRVGARIDATVVTVRQIDDILSSRRRANQLHGLSDEAFRDSAIYGFGLGLWSLLLSRIDHTVLVYPGFLSDPGAVFNALKLDGILSREEFFDLFQKVVEADRDNG